jgi:heat-inducible transcriptional repressor
MTQVPDQVPSTGDPATDAVVGVAIGALHALGSAEAGEQLFVGGSSRMAAAFDAVDTVRSVLTILEQQLVVVTLLRDIIDTGLTVAIGTEHGVEPLASCAIVVMPVSIDGVEAGTIGLLGPTRMNYPLALAAARVVGDRLGERLGETGR